MLDVKFIRENLDLVKKSTKEKGYKINVDDVVRLDDERKSILSRVEALRQKRNEIAGKMKGGKPAPELVEEGKKVKAELAECEAELTEAETKLNALLKTVPNIIFDDVPLGGEECSKEVKTWGKHHEKGVDHLDYAVRRD
jgi:seryl-tRNA synthetase